MNPRAQLDATMNHHHPVPHPSANIESGISQYWNHTDGHISWLFIISLQHESTTRAHHG
ncbi:hypothetical protein BCR42DRAFT_426338 [Absidia repens]|uniref:Uncharacterized protein n=1 Tax=Absidia repens TaxID=90262 RepID=A0A1X2I0Y3_9FUNG|nr:hypothetical protein BCR42DRAFT_426338 [Absidia repens]